MSSKRESGHPLHSIYFDGRDQNLAIACRNTLPAIAAKEHGSRCPSTCGQFFYGFGRQRLAANAPLPAVNLKNFYPCHAAHVFAFDRNHGIGQLLNNLLFLLGVEYALDQMDIDLWHCLSMDLLRQSTSWWSWYRPLRCLRLRRSMQPPQRPGNRYEPSGVLAFAIGFGGSMTWFGSSAGAALANIYPEARSVGLWLRHGWHVALAYVIGFFIMLAILGWNPDVSPRKSLTFPNVETSIAIG